MIERYAFKRASNSLYDTGALTFETLLKDYGMFLKSITDTAAVGWNVSSITSPYSDGGNVTYKAAKPREINIEFGYTGKLPPDVADELLFDFLGDALASSYPPFNDFVISDTVNNKRVAQTPQITLKKTTNNGVTKYIDGTIQSINHSVFEEEPTLQISILADSYWRGEETTVNLNQYLTYIDTYNSMERYGFNNLTFRGEVACPYKIKIEAYRTQSGGYNAQFNINLFGHNGLSVAIPNPAISQSAIVEIDNNKNLTATLTSDLLTTNIIDKMDTDTTLTRLYPNYEIDPITYKTFNILMDSESKSRFQGNELYFSLVYCPLYIR